MKEIREILVGYNLWTGGGMVRTSLCLFCGTLEGVIAKVAQIAALLYQCQAADTSHNSLFISRHGCCIQKSGEIRDEIEENKVWKRMQHQLC